MAYPKVDRSTQITIVAGTTGTTLYGNRAAYRTLARWMSWLAVSNPRDHYEMHVPWHLQPPFRRDRIKVLRRTRAGSTRSLKRFEVTFMVVDNRDLADLARKSRSRPKIEVGASD